MPSLEGKPLGTEYKRLLTIDQSSNTGVDGTPRTIQTGDGVNTSLQVSTKGLYVQSAVDGNRAFKILNANGDTRFEVDTSDNTAHAGLNDVNVHTHYKNINMSSQDTSGHLAGNHHPISLSGNYGHATAITFGTGTDPATTFTTSDSNGVRASDLAHCLWYMHDAITLDEIIHIEGADAATGDTTRMHLFQYDLTSGATNSLTNGVLLAHSADTTNAGSEQIYKQSWTIDSADVAAGKVIIAFFEAVSVNSDYSINLSIKYHIQ